MNRDEAREAAIDDYRLRFGEVKGYELDAVVFGFNRGYQAGSEGQSALRELTNAWGYHQAEYICEDPDIDEAISNAERLLKGGQ